MACGTEGQAKSSWGKESKVLSVCLRQDDLGQFSKYHDQYTPKHTYLPTTFPLPLHPHTLPLRACGGEVNWQHLLSRRQHTLPNPLHPPGHLETPAWLWAPKVMGGGWGRDRERGRDAESKLAAGTLASGDVVRQAGKLCQAGTPPRDRWFTDLDRMQGERERDEILTNAKNDLL